MRASVVAERAGIRSVSIVGQGFAELGRAVGAVLGAPHLAIAVYPDVLMTDTQLAASVERLADDIIAGLQRSPASLNGSGAPPDLPDRAVVASGTLDEIEEAFEQFGWSDGLPIVPPTVERVQAFLRHIDRDPAEAIGVLLPENAEATVWNVAVNGVMAGCRPEYMPLLVAIVEAIADPVFQLENAGSTSGLEPLVIVSGPIGERLGFNSGQGVTRIGRRANTSVGRFLRLVMRNVAGFRIPPGTHDLATFGANFNVALAEDDVAVRALGWPNFAMDRGFDQTEDVVTVLGSLATTHTAPAAGSTPEELLRTLVEEIGQTLWAKGSWTGLYWGILHPLLVLSPAIAAPIRASGWTKDDVRQYLWEHTRIRVETVERSARADGAAFSFSRWVDEGRLPREYATSNDPDREVPAILSPDDILIVVAGNPNRNHAMGYLQHGGYGSPVSKRIGPARGS